MTCKEAEKLIPLFLKDELDTDDLREFMEHVDKCEECREELSIQFLVLEGMARLESGNVFDLQNELKARIEETEHILKWRESMQWLLYALEGLVGVALITLIALLVFF
ncbi:MAG: anti-sigma factor [Firmicutes bacterium]|nr:anti-sigma factor [Bacillota bacterium]